MRRRRATNANQPFWDSIMTIKQDSVVGVIIGTLKRKPELLALLLIVGGFLYYMNLRDTQSIATQTDERRLMLKTITAREDRENLIASQRIQTCHDIQEQSNEAMNNIAEALRGGAQADARMQQTVSSLVTVVNELRRSNEDLRGAVIGLAAMFEFSRSNPIDPYLIKAEPIK